MFATITADYFGENNNATNYGMVYSSKLVSGLGAGMGFMVVDAWGLNGAFIPAGSISFFAGFLALFLAAPGRDRKGNPLVKAEPAPVSRETD